MSVHLPYTIVVLIVCFSISPSVSQLDGSGSGSGSGSGAPATLIPSTSAPPVNVSFTLCASQAIRSRHITCAPDGSFYPVQCMGKKCHCVDTQTGEVLTPLDYTDTRQSVNCSEAAQVPCNRLTCGSTICSRGYQSDSDGCPTCTCKPLPPPVDCKSIRDLLDGECQCDCVEIKPIVGMNFSGNMKDSCPTCDRPCNNILRPIGTCVTRDSTCPTGSELRIVGRYGTPECVSRLDNDDVCAVHESQDFMSGLNAQTKMVGRIGRKMPDCQEGSICVQTGHRDYRCQTDNLPCAVDRSSNPHMKCDIEGNFMPLQCDPIQPANTSMMCRCVNVMNGTTLSGAEVRVDHGMTKPNCQPRDCSIPGIRNSRMFKVKHGGTYFDVANCRSCQCNDGDAESFCSESQSNCASMMSQNNCTLEDGLVISHGEMMTFECEMCGCRNGQVHCVTIGDCEPEIGEMNMCQQCEMLPPNPVCGPDGRNHKTECAAVYCAGIPAMDILEGPCQSNDICDVHPCDNDAFTCVPRGGVACIGTNGCAPDQLRTCINIDTLQCAGNESSMDVEYQVCGSDGVTYSSTCSLLQTTVDVRIAHSGACESDACTSMGEVCGSDGVTYPNPCVLRSQAVTRLDYPSACITVGSTSEAICENVKTQGLCIVNTDNCDSPHLPKIGCCPICGGAVTIALDRDALTVAGSINSDFLSIGYLASKVLELFSEVPCTALIDITSTSDIELSLISENPSQMQGCVALTEEISRTVNGENGLRRTRQTSEDLPQVFDYTVAAATAQLVPRQVAQTGVNVTTIIPGVTTAAEDLQTTATTTSQATNALVDSSDPTNPSSDGAMSVHVTLGALSLLVLSMLSVLLG